MLVIRQCEGPRPTGHTEHEAWRGGKEPQEGEGCEVRVCEYCYIKDHDDSIVTCLINITVTTSLSD